MIETGQAHALWARFRFDILEPPPIFRAGSTKNYYPLTDGGRPGASGGRALSRPRQQSPGLRRGPSPGPSGAGLA
ncbi:hypothetical protein NL676_024383 [Syzygium grande]|nr:hypothetical protein NL676_024383 [Syzygium grande]